MKRTLTGRLWHLLFGAAVCLLPAGAIAAADAGEEPRAPVMAVPAADFLSSLGANSSVSRRGEKLADTVEAAKYIGLRWIRTGYEGGLPIKDLIDLHNQTGVRFSYGLLSGGADIARLLNGARQLAAADALLALEGPNEPNNWGVTYDGQAGGGHAASWLAVARLQRDLYAAVKSDPVLKKYPVWTISESGAESDNVGLQFLTIPGGAGCLMPDGTRYADYANAHNYFYHPNSPRPRDNQTWNAADPTPACKVDGLYGNYGSTWARHYAGYSIPALETLPRVTTETGATIGGEITEETHALNLLTMYLDQFKRGWRYTAVYLLRDRTDEGGNQQFGFYKPDYSPRRAAVYLHNLISILADPGPTGKRMTPRRGLGYSIPNQPATVHDLLLQKSDGTLELVVWDERIEGSENVTVELGNTFAAASVYDPTLGITPTRTLGRVSSLTLTLSDHPEIIEIPAVTPSSSSDREPRAGTATAASPYIDPRYLTAVPFGAHSHWLQPWRAYQETIPAQRFLDAQGVVLNGSSDADNFDLVCRMLAKNGIRHARIEEGWGSVDWEDETRLNDIAGLRKRLLACQHRGIRPLILLNANSGAPCPTRFFDRVLDAPARKGDRRVVLTDTTGLVPGYSGFRNITDNRASEVIVTGIDGTTVTLSKPLPRDLGDKGSVARMTTLKYRPFGPPDGAEYRATLDGWTRYVGTVARAVAGILGTAGKSDLGFDMEIWNELSFGSSFLTVNAYYDPKFADYAQDAIFAALVKTTADLALARPAEFAGVRFVDGFRNTIPWPAASTEPPRVSAMSAHPYGGRHAFPRDEQRPDDVNALFQIEHPGFVPTYSALFPEYYGTYIQTETLLRDLGPVPTPVGQTMHGRDTRVIDGKIAPCPLWFTEIGFAPGEENIKYGPAALALKAKTAARYECFFIGRGLERIYFYSAFSGDTDLGVVQDNFLAYARTHDAYPANDAPYTSPMLRTIGHLVSAMKDRVDPSLSRTRPIRIESVTDRHNHFQFAGDGTAAHPTLYNRDVLALLPYQVNAHRFILAYYVMTRDVLKALAPEEYTVRLSGLRGHGAKLRAYDPIADRSVPVRNDSATGDSLTVTLSATDAPRLLFIDEH